MKLTTWLSSLNTSLTVLYWSSCTSVCWSTSLQYSRGTEPFLRSCRGVSHNGMLSMPECQEVHASSKSVTCTLQCLSAESFTSSSRAVPSLTSLLWYCTRQLRCWWQWQQWCCHHCCYHHHHCHQRRRRGRQRRGQRQRRWRRRQPPQQCERSWERRRHRPCQWWQLLWQRRWWVNWWAINTYQLATIWAPHWLVRRWWNHHLTASRKHACMSTHKSDSSQDSQRRTSYDKWYDQGQWDL